MEEIIKDLRESIEDIDTLIWVLEGKNGSRIVDNVLIAYSNIPTDLVAIFKKLKENFSGTVIENNSNIR